MLQPGLYEQVINNALSSELSEIPEARKSTAPIDTAEASKVLAQYLTDVVQKGLENVQDNGGGLEAQIQLANQIVNTIQNTTQEADFASLGVDQRAEQLLALLRDNDPRLVTGKSAKELERPETSIAQSSLFTGAIHEPQMYTELKKEIVSADRIDMLVSFIKWSGLRLIMDELRQFTQSGGELRIITTSYMGATDVKAIEELRQLPNTKIKVSYDTKRTRLHAKTYVFYRDTGFTTAYVGSSNLSNAAISSGLEWNVKAGEKINVVVPTGNFGNILAAYYAKNLGVPIAKLICASNDNKVLYDFFQTGTYDKNREFVLTTSPSMDILISSNLERLIYLICGEDSEKTKELMEELKTTGKYTITPEMKEKLADFAAGYSTEEETAESIHDTYQKTGYVMDTHTAVAAHVCGQYCAKSGDQTKCVIASTASPYKFVKSVMSAIDAENANADEFDLLPKLQEVSGVPMPQAIKDILDAKVLHDLECDADKMKDTVKGILGV